MWWKWSGLAHTQSKVGSLWLAGLWNSVGYLEPWCGYCVLIHIGQVECLRPSKQMEAHRVMYVTLMSVSRSPGLTVYLTSYSRSGWLRELYAHGTHASKGRAFLGIGGKILKSDLHCILDQFPMSNQIWNYNRNQGENIFFSLYFVLCTIFYYLTYSAVRMVACLLFLK